MKQLNFQSENLVVDWISFNAKGLTDPEPIAEYLLGFGFNSVQLNKLNSKFISRRTSKNGNPFETS